ncbi:MAG: cob(I)yrinic acid a,c-diamide adenosyltransferase, partial [Pseudomonadota bacterium]|nr:cob(I)yrinic acid a,c-diamide adenosyltransferase [Pseudomonadota bacterium]
MTEATDHKQKMQDVQAKQRAKVAERVDPGRGLVLVHTGKGKGKSSSAFGVVIRALGWKQTVGVVQFIKGKWITGERRFFEEAGNVTWYSMGEGFTWDTQDKARDIAAATAAFDKAREMMQSGDYDLVVLDEINIALRYEYLSVDTVLEALKARSDRTSVILTGRDAKPEICDYA